MHTKILLPSFYLPPVEYFTHFLSRQQIIIEKHEHFQKQTYRNRCHIYSPNGILKLTIPIQHTILNNQVISEVKVSNEYRWQMIHWRSIESAYRSSAFFEYYEDDFKFFFEKEVTYLWEFNQELISLILKMMKIKVDLQYNSEYQKHPDSNTQDLRKYFSSKNSLQKDGKFIPEEYHQVFSNKHGFIPNLSILDLLFNEGPQAIAILQNSKTSQFN